MLTGYITATFFQHTLVAALRSTAIILGGLALSVTSQAEIFTEEDVFSDVPMVTGPSHFPQKISDTPTAVSIIDRQMIDASGALEIVDLFRMIPGFQVYSPHSSRHAINYHGFAQEYSSRMEVKVNGRSVYEPAENAVLWPTLGIEMDDIDYIEVIRGANAPADGSNATIASINIMTKSPVASKGWRVRTAVGEWDTMKTSAAYSGVTENSYYKVNSGYRYSSGLPNTTGVESDDDVESSYINFQSIITPNLVDSIDIQFGYSDSNLNTATSGSPIDANNIFKLNYESYYFFSHWERQLADDNSFEVLFYYNNANIEAPRSLGLLSDILRIPPNDVPLIYPGLDDFEVVAGVYDSYARRSDLEFRYKGELSSSVRYMWGAATRYDEMHSKQQFMDATGVEESSQRLFSNFEAKPSERWTLNAGAILEYNPIVHTYGSYRLSANYHFTSNHSLRFSYNDGERSPGVFEANQQGGLRKAGHLLDAGRIAPDNIKTEKFEGQQISYYGHLLDQTLTIELKLFKEKSRDLVKYTNMYTLAYFGEDDIDHEFSLRSNSAEVNVQGVETQVKYQPDRHWLVNFQYSYLEQEGMWLRDNYDQPSYEDWSNIVPAEMGSLTLGYFFDSGFETSMLWYYQGEVEWEQGDFSDDYNRIDLRVAKRWTNTRNEVLLELIGQNVFDEDYTEFHHLNVYQSRYILRLTLGF